MGLQKFLHKQQAFTLLEVMVSLVIFLLVSAGMATSYIGHLKRNTDTETDSEALAAAQRVLDVLRLQSISSLPNSGTSTQTISIGQRDFSVSTSYCVVNTYCNTSNNRHIRVAVYYKNNKAYEVDTVYTRLR